VKHWGIKVLLNDFSLKGSWPQSDGDKTLLILNLEKVIFDESLAS
jgi:hypothetical protein